MSAKPAVLSLVLGLSLGVSGAAGGETSARLRTSPITMPQLVLSSSDVRTERGTYIPIRSNTVLPANYIDMTKTTLHTISLAGIDYSLERRGSGFFLASPSGRSMPLKLSGTGFPPVPLSLPGKLRYVLSFPYVSRSAISYRSGSTQKAKLGRHDLCLYDDNTDGRYTTSDTYAVGRTLVFAPISSLVSTPTNVYRLGQIAEDGSKITYSRHTGEVGTLSMKCRTSAVAVQVAVGSAGAGLNLVMTSRTRATKVVPGSYTLLYGLAWSSTKRKAYAGIIPGSFSPVQVTAGGSAAAVEIGAPFRLDFDPKVSGKKITLSPSTFKLVGKGGEEYVSYNRTGNPVVSLFLGNSKLSSSRIPST